MPAARYWRIVGVDTWGGGDLELSELQLHDASGRVDQLATLTCSHAPIAGSLAALGDGDTAQSVRWSRAQYSAPGFWLQWDFGSGVTKDVAEMRVGAGQGKDLFSEWLSVRTSADAVAWSDPAPVGAEYPGASAIASVAPDPDYGKVAFLLGIPPVAGSTAFSDRSTTGKGVTAYGNVTTSLIYGSPTAYFDGVGDYLAVQNSPDLTLPADFAFEVSVRFIGGLGVQQLIYDDETFAAYGILFQKNGADKIAFYYMPANVDPANGGNLVGLISTSSVVLNQRYDVEVSRIGSTLRLFLNGALEATAALETGVGIYNPGGAKFIGQRSVTNSLYLYGHIDRFRVTQAGRHTASFTPQALPLQPACRTLRRTAALSVGRASHGTIPAFSTRPGPSSAVARDIEFGGRGQILGSVKVDGTPDQPVHRRVRLLRDRDGLLARETWSDQVTGEYAFTDIDERQTYSVVSSDHTGALRAVIADRLQPEVPA